MINPTRSLFIDYLISMGAKIDFLDKYSKCGEEVVDIDVTASELKGVTTSLNDAPSIIDEFLILSVAAAYAKGESKFCGVSELKVKESDRLEAIINMLTASGVKCETKDDDLIIYGNGEVPGGSDIKSNYDHRVAMSALILGLGSKSQIRIDDVSPIATSFPNFMEIYHKVGEIFTVDEKIIIAIDGPAASGKGTVARKLAKIFNLPHLDSGQLYRYIAYQAIKSAINLNDKSALLELTDKIAFDISEIEDLRNDEISTVASIISQYSEIRDQLIEYQRDFASNGAVVDGRDIGTIIFPNADYKFYITASLDQRTERRYLQLKKDNTEIDRNNIKNDINNRDLRDINRKIAPLKKAEDAIEIDTTEMKIDDVIDFIVKYIHKG